MEKNALASRTGSFGPVLIALTLIFVFSAAAFAGTATIGGRIWEGSRLPDGRANYEGNAKVMNARVMVQDMDSGQFVAYGSVVQDDNLWSAAVPAPGEYVVVFAADGFDSTSREFKVDDNANVSKDAYLARLPLPAANLLVYAFIDNYINGEDDFPVDTPLNGATFVVSKEDGTEVARGVSGSCADLPPDAAFPDGYYYFKGLQPGKYVVKVDMSNMPPNSRGTNEWYQTSSIEGGPGWELDLYPGDPGVSIGVGGYLAWFSFVGKKAPLGPAPSTGTISGALKDADGDWFADEPFNPNPALNVTPNSYVPKGLAVLSPNAGQGSTAPIATAEADANGNFTFENVPPGNYKIFATDLPLDYIWSEAQVTVAPGANVSGLDVFIPRWFSRVHGYVTDRAAGRPVAGANVYLRLEDGSIWKKTTTGADGWYNFDELEEVEVLGTVDVEPPRGYRAAAEGGVNLNTRTVQWFGFNYRADLEVEPVPQNESFISGFVFNDSLAPGAWTGDGLYDASGERTFPGVTVELWDELGTAKLASAVTRDVDEASLAAQGWHKPYTWPPDEFGGVFKNNVPGYFELRGISPGSYIVRVVPPPGFSPSPAAAYAVTARPGENLSVNLGVNTLAPLAGEIEGGVFDDINLDTNPSSLLFEEKAPIPGTPVGIYDHMGYFLGSARMGSALCYTGSTVCPPGESYPQKPEVERRAAPGIHIYYGNDPSLPGYNPDYEAFAFPYGFDQGKGKFEADWSLIPAAFNGLGAAMAGNGNVIPDNAPVIAGVAQVADNGAAPFAMLQRMFAMNESAGVMNDSPLPSLSLAMLSAVTVASGTQPAVLRITGSNFGDREGYSTVTLGGARLPVRQWSKTLIDVALPPNAVSGYLVVATSTGISNSMPVNIVYSPSWAAYMADRSVFVDAAFQGAPDGTRERPWKTISDALMHLPPGVPRYVFVAPGTYREKVRITASDVRIIGAGPRETIVDGLVQSGLFDGNGRGPVFFIGAGGMKGAVSNVAISGFTIRGGSSGAESGGGIFGDYGNSDIDINNSVIIRNHGVYGGGVWLHKSNHNVAIWSNTIAENGNGGGYGGGISVNDEPEYGPAETEPDHTADDHNPGPPPGTYRIFNNLIFHNFSPDYGGGISLYEVKDRLNVTGNMIMENKSDDHGGGMFFEDTGPADIGGNVFLRNYCADDGGAISFEDVGDDISIIRIYNNLFAENIADDRGENTARGGAISFDDTFRAEVFSNTIVGNIAAGMNRPRGGAIDSERNGHEYPPGFSDPKIYNNVIWSNWRLEYDPSRRRGGEGTGDYTTGRNYRWTPDNLHVDNPALQAGWESQNNSESFTYVRDNDIYGGYGGGLNLNSDPAFVNPAGLDWHLSASSPLKDKAAATSSPAIDLERLRRIPGPDRKVELGAYDYFSPQPHVIWIPAGILGAIRVPRP